MQNTINLLHVQCSSMEPDKRTKEAACDCDESVVLHGWFDEKERKKVGIYYTYINIVGVL
jgi:hypothetical protein